MVRCAGLEITVALPDRVPYVMDGNHHVINLDEEVLAYIDYNEITGNNPSGISHPQLLKSSVDNQQIKTMVNDFGIR